MYLYEIGQVTPTKFRSSFLQCSLSSYQLREGQFRHSTVIFNHAQLGSVAPRVKDTPTSVKYVLR